MSRSSERGQLHQHPERHDQAETNGNQTVRDTGADANSARCALAREVGRPCAKRRQRIVDALPHALIFEKVGIPLVDAVAPVDHVLHIAGNALHQIGELIAEAKDRREHQEHNGSDHYEHNHICDSGAYAAIDAALLERIDDAAQAEHDDGGPNDHADGRGKHVHEVDNHRKKQDGANRGPYAQEAAARVHCARARQGVES